VIVATDAGAAFSVTVNVYELWGNIGKLSFSLTTTMFTVAVLLNAWVVLVSLATIYNHTVDIFVSIISTLKSIYQVPVFLLYNILSEQFQAKFGIISVTVCWVQYACWLRHSV